MRALFLAPYPPFPPHGGGPQRMYQLLRQLAPRHELHLLTFAPSAAAVAALAPLREVATITTVPSVARTVRQRLQTTLLSAQPDMLWRGASTAYSAALDKLLATTAFDVVQAESIEMTQYAPLRAGPRRPAWVYDAFNVEYTIQQRASLTDLRALRTWPKAGYSLIQWRKLQRWEQQLSRRFDWAFAVSADDQRLLGKLDAALPTSVVPNGVDTAFFAPQPHTGAPVVLFTGTLDYRPNIDALVWFAAEIWPLIRRATRWPGWSSLAGSRRPRSWRWASSPASRSSARSRIFDRFSPRRPCMSCRCGSAVACA